MCKYSESRLISAAFSAIVVALFVLLLSLSANAQTPQKPNTDSALDNRMRSEATVDPLTLSLQLSINLGSYPGRDGLALPVTMNYSSHLWGIRHVTTDRCGMSPYWEYYYRYRPEFGRGSMAGWTSPLGMSDLLGSVNLELYDIQGHPVSTGAYKKIARMFATLPDGSRHELRKDDSLHDPAETITGKFYAVDDSRLVYDTTTSTLYLPDGTRIASGYIDKNGNKLVAGGSSYMDWTDTMGRAISSPLDTGSNRVGDNTSAVAFDKSFSVPGFNGGTLSYTMKWRKLQDVLTNTSDTLEYMGDKGNSGTCGSYYPPASPSLFVSNGDDSQVLMSTRIFNPVVLAEIDLPNGTSYKFTYNIYGEINKVVYPTGAYDKFAYSAVEPLNPGLYDGDPFFTQTNRGVVSRTQSEDGTTATEVTWTYAQVGRGVTNPDGTYSSITVYPGTVASAMKWGFESVIAGLPSEERTYNSSGTMLTRHLIDRTYDSVTVGGVAATRNPRVTREISVKFEPGDSNALVSLVTYDYDSNANPAYFANLNPTVVKQYNYVVVSASTAQTASSATLASYFSSSVPAKQVETDYLYDSNYLARNLTQVPTERRIKDGSGNVKAKTHFYCDESSYQSTTPGTMPTAASGTWIDPLTELGSTIGAARALPTTIRSYYDITNGYYIDTHNFYDQYGNVTKVRDGRGNDTTSAFDASYAFTLATSGTTAVPDSTGTYGSSTAFTSSATYDYSSGLPTSSTDINGQTTTISYADPSTSVLDPLLRPRVITAPNGQQTITEYGDTSGSLYIKVSSQIDSSNWKVGYKYFDNLGRVIRIRSVDPAGDDYTLKCYDNMGRVSKVTNPFRGYSTQTCATTTGLDWTSMTYDAEGRVTAVTMPDTAQVTTAYALATSGSVIGTAVTVTDQTNKSRKSVTDALARLTTVYEDPASLNHATSYSYDPLDNLTGVTQDSQTRFFMYDSLKRFIRARNPEQGTLPSLSLTDPTTGNSAWSIGYAYDASGNLAQKTDARGVVSTYAYDALNRNTTIDYSDTSSINPDVTRFYDGAVNGKGRFWVSYAGGDFSNGSTVECTAIDNYDALGNPTVQRQLFKANGTWGTTYQTSRAYNLAGAVTFETYPSGHTVSYSYDSAGRMNSFSGSLGNGTTRTYSTGIVYDPLGSLREEQFGTQIPLYHKQHYNRRGQLFDIRLSTVPWATNQWNWNRGAIVNYYSANYAWEGDTPAGPDNNGNVLLQQHWVPTDDSISSYNYTQDLYTYDSLNRIQSAAEVHGTPSSQSSQDFVQVFTYDRWGNRTINPASWGLGVNTKQFTVDTGTNRLGVPNGQSGTMSYDAAGNLITDTYSGAGAREFDAQNKMTRAWGGNNQWQSYTYNGGGQRTRRKIDGVETWQVYGFDGELLAEYAASENAVHPQKEYGYRNGELLITVDGPTNVALAANGGVASASTAHTCCGFSVGGAINGNIRGPWGNGEGWNDATPNELPDWFQVDFAGSKTIDEIDVFSLHDDYTHENAPTETQTFSLYGLVNFEVQYWNGSSWATIPGGSVSNNNKVWRKFTFAPLTTNKIRVWITGVPDSWSRLVEVQAWEAGAPNLALNKATSQSSEGWGGVSSRAVDGNTSGNWNDSSVTHTGYDNQPWWQVDLGASYSINNVELWNRTDCCGERLANFNVILLDANQSVVSTVNYPGQVGTSTTINISGNARYVKVQLLGTNYLSLAEVKVWGTTASPSSNVHWLVTDQVGTPRMIVDQAGTLASVKRHDYLPFGEELFAPVGGRTAAQGYASGDGVRQQFTSKDRDTETGLDYFGARYYSNQQGRFISVDPSLISAHPSNPQTWNRYSYTYNNPLALIDHNGKWPTSTHNKIVNTAFDTLSESKRAKIREGSASVDRNLEKPARLILENTLVEGMAPRHAMTPGSKVRELGSFEAAQKWASNEMYKFIDGKMAQAQKLYQAGENRNGVNDLALFTFGEGVHPVMDNMSPAHHWFQLYDLGPYEALAAINPLLAAYSFKHDMDIHGANETRQPTQYEMNAMIDEMRMRYLYAFGRQEYERAVSQWEREATAARLRERRRRESPFR